jgi:hypothetical protein
LIFDEIPEDISQMIEPFFVTITDWSNEAYLYFSLLGYDIV